MTRRERLKRSFMMFARRVVTVRLPGLSALVASTMALGLAGCSSSSSSSSSPRAVSVSVAGLPATLELPAGTGPFPAVVLVGGSGPNDRDETIGPNKPFRDIAVGMARRGIASVRYDKRTLVEREKLVTELATFTPTEEYVPDALAAVKLLAARPKIDSRRVFVLGHSQGGTFAPRIVSARPGVAGVILLAASSEPFGATLVRQIRYLLALGRRTGPAVAAELARVTRVASLLDDPHLPRDTPASALVGGLGPPYWLDLSHYDEVSTARALAQPILLLQGARDYQVTVADDLARWQSGLRGRKVTVKVFPRADHIFIDGSGPPDPAEYTRPAHVDPKVIATIATWISAQRRRA